LVDFQNFLKILFSLQLENGPNKLLFYITTLS
jgi:hypothetical protein